MPRRSRGCLACRRSRKRCDGAQPFCERCLKHNLVCSGYTEGPIVIDQTESVKRRHGRPKLSFQGDDPRLCRQPSTDTFVASAFLSTFIASVTSITDIPTKLSWLGQLSQMPESGRGTALNLAMRAAATAYCAVLERDAAALSEARRIYVQALGQQARSLSRLASAPTLALMGASAILSLFEAISPSDHYSYTVHLTAVRDMLALAVISPPSHNPSYLSLLRQIYTHVQSQSVFIMVTTIEPSPGNLAREGASVVIWELEDSSRPVADRLMAELPKLGKMIAMSDSDNRDGSPDRNKINVSIRALWAEYQADAAVRDELIESTSEGKHQYRDIATALTIAQFASASILLRLSSDGSYRESDRHAIIDDPFQTIVDCAEYLLPVNAPTPSESLPMYLPLSLVMWFSNSMEQRSVAARLARSRLELEAFVGLASRTIYRSRCR